MTREHRAWEMLIRRLNYLNSFGGNRSEMEKTTRIVAEIWDDAGHEEEPDLYPAPEPTYAERQAQWVKENDVKAGTKVRVTRTFTEDEDGSCCWEHDDLVGMTGVVGDYGIATLSVGVDMSDGSFIAIPYFALEVIKEPTYRPFANAEEFKPYREKWCLDNLKGRFKIDWHSDTHIYEYGNSFITWEEAFNKYKFEDGTPFGVKEQAWPLKNYKIQLSQMRSNTASTTRIRTSASC